jgi:CelD/BcsL family acetyltransferase involved in cellulose biosynthesis
VDAEGRVTFKTIVDEGSFAGLGASWDPLVRAMPRPSPFLLHGWLLEWCRHFGRDAELAIHVAYRGRELVGALPLIVRRRLGTRIAEFPGAPESALADLMLAAGESAAVGDGLIGRVRESGVDLLDVFGLPRDSRLGAALGPTRLHLIERVEAPVLDLPADWEAFHRARLPNDRRYELRRRLRRLAELGTVEVSQARTPEELEPALEESFRLHALRWTGRPDRSTFGTPRGMRFHRAALRDLARDDAVRITLLNLDGRAIAFHLDFVLSGRMYGHRLGFDPSLARFAPGTINTLDALKAAAAEGLTRFEFLGGAEPYKMALADRSEPLYQGLGMAGGVRGQAILTARVAAIRLWLGLRRSQSLRRFYYEGLAPARRVAASLRRAVRGPGASTPGS